MTLVVDEPPKSAAAALRRQQRIFEQAPGFIAILRGPDHVFEFVNRAYVRLAGERHYIGRPAREVLPEVAGQGFFELLDHVYRSGERHVAQQVAIHLQRATRGEAETRLVDFIYEPLLDDTGAVEGIFVEGHDVTEAQQAQERLRLDQRRSALLVELNDIIRDLDDPADVSYAAAELLGRALGVSRAGYGTINTADETITIERDWNAPGIQSLAGVLHFRDYGSYIEDLKRGETVVFSDAESDPRTAATAEALKAISAQAVVNMPVTEQGGFVALLYLNHATARAWPEHELALIREVAERTRTVVERRRAEQEARELSLRLKLAQRAARAVTWEHDVQQGLTRWSDMAALEELAGAALPQPTRLREVLQLIDPRDRERYVGEWRQRLDEGEGRVSFRLSRDGQQRVFETFGRVVERDADGTPRTLVGILLDVTDRARAEQGQRASEARLRLAIDAGRMAVWEHDPATDTLTSSPELNRLLGLPADAALNMAQLRKQYYPGEEERLIAEATAVVMRGERFLEAEYRFYRADGALRWFLMRADIRLTREGKPLRTTGVLLDITDRKAAEEALREREADLKAALDAGSLATFDYDHLAQRMKPSPRLSELYGFPPDHVLTLADIRSRYHPEDADDIVRRAREDESDPSMHQFRWVLRLLLPDGAVRWVEGRGEYLRNAEGRIVRSRGVVLDITERKRWEEHQRLLINELNHRVKNTLAVVQGLARQSFRTEADPERGRANFEARLAALSAAHNLLTRQSWEAAPIDEVVRSSLDALGVAPGRLRCAGPALWLPPQTAVSIALATHELCTNALKYGALSASEGAVEVEWGLYDRAGEPGFRLVWRERGGPPVTPPKRRGFGSRMIERGLASELAGAATIQFAPEGVVCTIDAPLPRSRDDLYPFGR